MNGTFPPGGKFLPFDKLMANGGGKDPAQQAGSTT
jgi:hypothetical protein